MVNEYRMFHYKETVNLTISIIYFTDIQVSRDFVMNKKCFLLLKVKLQRYEIVKRKKKKVRILFRLVKLKIKALL